MLLPNLASIGLFHLAFAEGGGAGAPGGAEGGVGAPGGAEGGVGAPGGAKGGVGAPGAAEGGVGAPGAAEAVGAAHDKKRSCWGCP